MLEQIFKAMLITSCAGAALTAVTALVKPITKKYFSAGWNYYVWLAVMLVMMLPVRFAPPRAARLAPVEHSAPVQAQTQHVFSADEVSENPAEAVQPIKTETPSFDASQIAAKANGITDILAAIWLIGAALMLASRLFAYAAFIHRMKKHSRVISCPEVRQYTKKRVTVRIGENISSPLTIGLFGKTLLLPDLGLTDIQLANILAHETTHLNRNDILYKWLVTLVKCVHWFNPAVYFAARQINSECEISCDAAVTESMNKAEKLEYVDTILALISDKNRKSIPLTTGMAGSRRMLERRFVMMTRNKRVNKGTRILSAALAAVTLAASIFTSGVLANEVLNERYIIEVRNNGNLMELENKPFFENNTEYLPLRETLEKMGALTDGNGLTWENGKSTLHIKTSASYVKEDGSIEYDMEMYTIEPGSDRILLGQRTAADDSAPFVIIDTATPLLREETLYVPFSYMEYFLKTPNMYPNSNYILNCQVWDTEIDRNTDRGPDYNETTGDEFDMVRVSAAPNTYWTYENPEDVNKQPVSVIKEFFKAFSSSDFETMKQYCTDSCVNGFFGDGYVFGMTRASIKDIEIDEREYAKSSNDFNVLVTVDMTRYEGSVYPEGQTEAAFYLILMRQPDGTYKIDEFATGL